MKNVIKSAGRFIAAEAAKGVSYVAAAPVIVRGIISDHMPMAAAIAVGILVIGGITAKLIMRGEKGK